MIPERTPLPGGRTLVFSPEMGIATVQKPGPEVEKTIDAMGHESIQEFYDRALEEAEGVN